MGRNLLPLLRLDQWEGNMKKLFISQPMRDKTDEQIIQERDIALAAVTKKLGEEVELIDTFFKEDPPKEVNIGGIWYLGKSLVFLAEADIVYFVKGWQNYRGCRLEHAVAVEYGVERIIEED